MDAPDYLVGDLPVRYQRCMVELKFRFNYARHIHKRFTESRERAHQWLCTETIALQYRKMIELLATASIAANHEAYREARANFAKDWNARLIFQDIARINPHFYPVPIIGAVPGPTPESPQIIDEYDDGFLTLNEAIELYEKCGGLLHAENCFASPRDLAYSHEYFGGIAEKFKRLTNAFWVCLVPNNHRYILQLELDTDDEVSVLAAIIGH